MAQRGNGRDGGGGVHLLWDRSRGRVRCPGCWYNLDGAGDAPVTCPECGRRTARAQHLRRTRRRCGAAALAAMVAIAAAWVAPVWATRGGLAVVPAPALRAAISLVYPQEAAAAHEAALGAPLPQSQWRQHLIAWGLAQHPPGPTIGPEDPLEDPSRWVSQRALARRGIALPGDEAVASGFRPMRTVTAPASPAIAHSGAHGDAHRPEGRCHAAPRRQPPFGHPPPARQE